MENPLTSEQTKTLQALTQLSPEEQQKQLPAFLKSLTPEQLAYLKQQQQGGQQQQCPFCLIRDGKIQSTFLYQDEHVFAVFDIRPASEGHVLVVPKKHYPSLLEMPANEAGSLFTVSHMLLSPLLKTLQAEGINLFVAEGSVAGQMLDHVIVHLIPRYQQDGLRFTWQGKETDPKKLEELKQKITRAIPSSQPQQKIVKQQPAQETTSDLFSDEPVPEF
jgi:histidine triad (HIT) family protein